jgi:hypothetical protein
MKIRTSESDYSKEVKEVLHKLPNNLIWTVYLGYFAVTILTVVFVLSFSYPDAVKTKARVYTQPNSITICLKNNAVLQQISVRDKEHIKKGKTLCVILKSGKQDTLRSPVAGYLRILSVLKSGDRYASGKPLFQINDGKEWKLYGEVFVPKQITNQIKPGTKVTVKYEDLVTQKTIFVQCYVKTVPSPSNVQTGFFVELSMPTDSKTLSYFHLADKNPINADIIIGNRNILNQLLKQVSHYYGNNDARL